MISCLPSSAWKSSSLPHSLNRNKQVKKELKNELLDLDFMHLNKLVLVLILITSISKSEFMEPMQRNGRWEKQQRFV